MRANGSFIATCCMDGVATSKAFGAFIGTTTTGFHVVMVFGILTTSAPFGAGMPKAKRRWVSPCLPPLICHSCPLRLSSPPPSGTARSATIAYTNADTSIPIGHESICLGTTTTTWDRIRKPTGVSRDLGSISLWARANRTWVRCVSPAIAPATPCRLRPFFSSQTDRDRTGPELTCESALVACRTAKRRNCAHCLWESRAKSAKHAGTPPASVAS